MRHGDQGIAPDGLGDDRPRGASSDPVRHRPDALGFRSGALDRVDLRLTPPMGPRRIRRVHGGRSASGGNGDVPAYPQDRGDQAINRPEGIASRELRPVSHNTGSRRGQSRQTSRVLAFCEHTRRAVLRYGQGGRRSSFWRVVLCPCGCARSPVAAGRRSMKCPLSPDRWTVRHIGVTQLRHASGRTIQTVSDICR